MFLDLLINGFNAFLNFLSLLVNILFIETTMFPTLFGNFKDTLNCFFLENGLTPLALTH